MAGNPFSLLRFGNIFGGSPQDEMGGFSRSAPLFNPTPPMGNDDDLEPFKFEPEHKYSDEFDQMIQQMPQRGNPGFWRKFAATLSAAGAPAGRGAEVAEHNLYAPYYRNMEDWQAKIKPVQAGMQDERARNAQQRQYTQSMNTYSIAAKNAETRQRAAEAKIENDKSNAETRKESMLVRKYKAEHPNHVYKTDADGNVYSINPQDNKVEYLRTDEGNPIHSDKLPEQTKMDIQLNHELQKIEARGQVQKDLVGFKQPYELEKIHARGGEARETKKTVPGKAPSSATDKPLTPSAEATAILNRANEWKARNPDLAKYITVKGRNVDIAKPQGGLLGKYGGGMPPDKRQEAEDYIYGTKPIAQRTGNMPSDSKPQVIEKEIPNSGGKIAISTDGGKTWKAK